jgi:CHAD domain-containing protein
MADGKWIHGLTASMPLDEAARRVLGARLEVVRDALPEAIESSDEDVEYVHQLRVGARRTAAALRIFEDCLPRKTRKTARREVKEIRRAAGDARDWDVFQAALDEWAQKRPAEEQPGLDFLRGYAFQQREQAQIGLNEMSGRAPDPDDLLEQVRKPKGKSAPKRLLGLAEPWLTKALRDLNEEVSQAGDDLEHLHRVRILGKRLRYGMEVFADCFPSSFRTELYPAVEEMQELLGHANDCHVSEQRLSALRIRLQASLPGEWPQLRAGVERLLQAQRRRLPQWKQRFTRWCERWRKASVPLAESLLQARLFTPPSFPSASENSCPHESCPDRAPSNGSEAPTASSG